MFRRAVARVSTSAVRARHAVPASSAIAGRTPVAAPVLSHRSFLQTREKSSLVSILKREVEEEKGNCFEGDELEELHDKINKVFALEDVAGNMEVVLTGEVKGDAVRIVFDTQDTLDLEDAFEDDEEDDEEDETEEEVEDDEEDEEDELPGIRFLAEITRENKGLQFECVASSNVTIERVRYLGDFAKDTEDEKLYFGPNFVDLELDLQEQFYKYLNERRVDDELASFITQYADLKEQREYLGFLENAVKFVQK